MAMHGSDGKVRIDAVGVKPRRSSALSFLPLTVNGKEEKRYTNTPPVRRMMLLWKTQNRDMVCRLFVMG